MLDNVKRILLVEDDDNDIELILSALKEYNLTNEVEVVKDGEEVFDYLSKQGKYLLRKGGHPICILLDIKLFAINGLEVLKRIKTDEALKYIPVVMLSSSREEKDIDLCYRMGANAYVVKPVNFHEFIDTIKNLGMFWALINEPFTG